MFWAPSYAFPLSPGPSPGLVSLVVCLLVRLYKHEHRKDYTSRHRIDSSAPERRTFLMDAESVT